MIQTSVEQGSTAGPFTFAAVWHVKRDSVVQFEGLLRQIVAAAAVFPGHEGVHAVTPAASSPPVYRVVVRFGSQKQFQYWQQSDVCQDLIAKASTLAASPVDLQMKTGLEAWFQDPAGSNASPPMYKTSILMWLVLFPLTLFCQWIVILMNLHLSPLIATGITMAFEIALVSYVLMPALARIFAFWLYANTDRAGGSR